MNQPSLLLRPTHARYGVLGFACALSMITYLDRVCFGTVAPDIQREFSLSDSQLGMLFTAFALAYAAFEVPSGWLGDLFGARRTLIRIVLWWSAFTALTGTIYPSHLHHFLAFAALLSVRFLFGVGEAGAYPNISRAFANWFPFSERGQPQGAVWMAGRFAGGVSPLAVLVLVYTVTAADGSEVRHWRHIFWIFGSLGLVWCVAFVLWFRDRPEEHPWVNAGELAVIRGPAAPHPLDLSAGAKPRPADDERVQAEPAVTGIRETPAQPVDPAPAHEDHSHRGVPWARLLKDANLWLLCLMYFCAAYGWYFNITWLPKYLKSEAGVTEKTHGVWVMSLLAGAPLLVGSLACLLGGLATDFFIKKTGNRKWGRRLFGAVGHGVCALCYFLTLAAGAQSPWLFVLFLALAAFFNDLTMGSAWASCIDIGGKYAGIVSGCMNTVGNLGGALAGVSTGWVIQQFGKHDGWTVNLISYGLAYVIAVFLWLGFDATRTVAQSTEG